MITTFLIVILFYFYFTGYDRPNLFFEVREKSKRGIDAMPAMLKYVRTHPPNTTGIVYCFSKSDCEKAAAYLTFNNVSIILNITIALLLFSITLKIII